MRPGITAVLLVIGCARALAAPPAAVPTPPAVAPVRPVLPVLWLGPGTPSSIASAARAQLLGASGTPGEPLVLGPAPDAPPAAPERRRAGLALYDDVRFDEARVALDQAAADAVARGAAGLTQAELSDVYVYRALCSHARGAAARAWEDFVRAAAVAPTRVLDPARFPPKAVAMLQRAAEAVATAPHGSLTVVAPAGTRVFVDGRDVGAAPLDVPSLPYGEHLVRLEHPGYVTLGTTVLIAARAQRLDPPLRRHAPPDDLTLAEAARARGAAFALLVAAFVEGGTPRIEVRLVNRAGVAHLVERGALAGLDSALARAVAATAPPRAAPPPTSSPTTPVPTPPWYRRPWVWIAVGVAVTSAAVATSLAYTGGSAPSGLGATLDLGAVRR